MTQLADARLNAGLDKEPEANIYPRGVIKTTDTSPRDDLYPGVLPTIEGNKKSFQSWVIDTMMIAMTIAYTKRMKFKISHNLSYIEQGLAELLGPKTTWNRVTGLEDRTIVTVVM